MPMRLPAPSGRLTLASGSGMKQADVCVCALRVEDGIRCNTDVARSKIPRQYRAAFGTYVVMVPLVDEDAPPLA